MCRRGAGRAGTSQKAIRIPAVKRQLMIAIARSRRSSAISRYCGISSAAAARPCRARTLPDHQDGRCRDRRAGSGPPPVSEHVRQRRIYLAEPPIKIGGGRSKWALFKHAPEPLLALAKRAFRTLLV